MAFDTSRISPELLLAAGSALAGGQTVGQQLGNLGAYTAPVFAAQREKRDATDQKNKTLEYLRRVSPGYAQSVEAGVETPTQAYTRYLEDQKPKKANLINTGDGLLYDSDSKTWIQPPADMVKTRNKFGLNTIPGVDAEGKAVLIQVNDQGVATQTQMPQGVQISKEPIKIDAGTNWVLLDPITRQPISTIPKNNSQEQADIAQGKVEGATKAALPAIRSTASTIKGMINDVKNDEYRGRGTGLTSVFNSIPATGGYDFQRKVDQLKGQAFLQAIQQMQGFGALSNQEGATATAAISRLDTAQSEEAFNKALSDLEAIIDRGVAKAEQMAGQQPQTTQSSDVVKLGPNGEGYDQVQPGAKYVAPDGSTRVKGGQ